MWFGIPRCNSYVSQAIHELKYCTFNKLIVKATITECKVVVSTKATFQVSAIS